MCHVHDVLATADRASRPEKYLNLISKQLDSLWRSSGIRELDIINVAFIKE